MAENSELLHPKKAWLNGLVLGLAGGFFIGFMLGLMIA